MGEIELRPGLGLPVAGELSEVLAQAIACGQPLVLTWRGRPAGVLVDLESYLEAEDALSQPGSPATAAVA
ncbi:MAG: type II toxin-antitoxin system prevent-host-death family antitoxin [Acidimicrobiales bacterium]